MKDFSDCTRTFVHYSEAWYSSVLNKNSEYTDEVGFGMSHSGGGTSGEMMMRWYYLGGKDHPRLEVFDDGWAALASFGDLIFELEKLDNTDPTPKQFCEILLRLGFVDNTERENPYKKGEPAQEHLSREEMLEKALADVLDWLDDENDDPDKLVRAQNARKLLPVAKG